GITNLLLEHKKTGQPGVYGLFANANDDNWQVALDELEEKLRAINGELFSDPGLCRRANQFIDERLAETRSCLTDLERVCQHGHFALEAHLKTVREMLASIGETHSAWNLTQLLRQEGINARFVDLTGWNTDKHLSLDDRIREAFARIDVATELPIVTGYAPSKATLISPTHRPHQLRRGRPARQPGDGGHPPQGRQGASPERHRPAHHEHLRAGARRYPGDQRLRQRHAPGGNHCRCPQYLRHRVLRAEHGG